MANAGATTAGKIGNQEQTMDDDAKAPSGRADAAILEMKDLGENVYYGG